MAGSKKEKRREKKNSEKQRQQSSTQNTKNNGKERNNVWYIFDPHMHSSSSNDTVVHVSPEECFSILKSDALDLGPMGNVMDGLMRNMVRMTQESWTHRFGALTCLKGKNLLWLQLLLIDDDRVIQGKFYVLGGTVAISEDDSNVVQRSKDLFREAAPFLLQGAGAGVDPPHWVFSRTMLVPNYTGSIDANMVDFPSYDPLNGLCDLTKDLPSGVRCTEAFLFFAGDFAVKEDGFNTREAVIELVRELTTAEGILKLDAFTVCCGSVKVSKDKLEELKNVHLAA